MLLFMAVDHYQNHCKMVLVESGIRHPLIVGSIPDIQLKCAQALIKCSNVLLM